MAEILYKKQKTPYIIQWAMGLVSLILPFFVKKRSGLVVLTSFHSDGFRGNTRVIFEKLCEIRDSGAKNSSEKSRLKPVWLTRNASLVEALNIAFGTGSAVLLHSFFGLKTLAAADLVLFTHGTSDYPFTFLPRTSTRIQTYHGLPTKRGEYLRPKHGKKPNVLHRFVLRRRFNPINWFLSSSGMVSRLFFQRFGLPLERFAETGYPSYDRLIHDRRNPDFVKIHWPDAAQAPSFRDGSSAESGRGVASGSSAESGNDAKTGRDVKSASIVESGRDAGNPKVILYAPTFRRRQRTRLFPFADVDLHQIAEKLDEKNAIIAFRAHPNERLDLSRFREISARFVDAGQHKIENIFDLLVHTDVVVTDYSSVYLEGLLRDIPPVFIPYDFEMYERGQAFDYTKYTPGPKVKTQAQFLDALDEALSGAKNYAEDRKYVCGSFFELSDGESTVRVIEFLERLAD